MAFNFFPALMSIPHEFDECRFDVSVNDCVWYLRAETPEDKQHWVDFLEAFKAESGYGSENSLKRHGSAISLTSNTLSSASASSFKKGNGLKEKLAEMETFRDILCSQMETLQGYFDSCAEAAATSKKTGLGNEKNVVSEHALKAVDFKGEAMTFKATARAVLTTLQHCLEAVGQREEVWRRRLERETERRRKLEEIYRVLKQQPGNRVIVHGGPDHEEGPHSTLHEDEFYDAVESGLDKLEEEAVFRERLAKPLSAPLRSTSKATQHRLWPEIEKITREQIHYASLGLGEGGWQLFAEDGEMKMYRREEEDNGLVVDPLKACHVVRGVTGHEMCHYFFSPQYRHEWEGTLEQMTVIETIADDTLLFHQIHKRIWPASQRDAFFWSHITQVPNQNDRDSHNIWVVVNHSTDAPDHPPKSKYVRISLTVCLYCQTLVTPPSNGAELTRENVTCKITYCSVVNPGGWVPASALRAIYKREYPKFLKRFTNYVINQTKNKPILF
ncbi:ceramide transfer protein isoform X2 [Lycorma delicatula]|uniref:ceramide transfer protein isoform X2 n=1 Tax=Lycorma delicatula TaxID=130591 RepID=UPI003F515148